MKYLFTRSALLGLLITLINLVVPPLLMLVYVFRIRWDAAPGDDGWVPCGDGWAHGNDGVARGDPPDDWIGRWLDSPDERLPGDLREPTVKWLYERCGRAICAYYWLGLRNRGLGLAFMFGRPVEGYLDGDLVGYQEAFGAWRYIGRFWIAEYGWGEQTTRNRFDGKLYAIPWFTVKRRKT